jgi:hypothetical protein
MIDPGTMQQMLAQQLMQPPQQSAPVGGGMAGPQMQGQQGPQAGAAQLIQKILAMKAMQNQQDQAQQLQPKAFPMPQSTPTSPQQSNSLVGTVDRQ